MYTLRTFDPTELLDRFLILLYAASEFIEII